MFSVFINFSSFINFFLLFQDSSFLKNLYVSSDGQQTLIGYGTVNFLGNVFNMENVSFIQNFNTAGGAIFIGGSKDFYITYIYINNVNFLLNVAYTFGGAISFGSDIIQTQGVISNINCSMNIALCNN